MSILTLVFFIKDDQILLGYKKRGFGAGRWNGFGGKVEKGESIEEAAKREAVEECGLSIKRLEKRAIHTFSFEGNADVLEVHTFWVKSWEGEPVETEEMKPQWFHFDAIPYDSMWPDDKLWLPQFLGGKCLKTAFLFGEKDAVLQYDVQRVAKEALDNK